MQAEKQESVVVTLEMTGAEASELVAILRDWRALSDAANITRYDVALRADNALAWVIQ